MDLSLSALPLQWLFQGSDHLLLHYSYIIIGDVLRLLINLLFWYIISLKYVKYFRKMQFPAYFQSSEASQRTCTNGTLLYLSLFVLRLSFLLVYSFHYSCSLTSSAISCLWNTVINAIQIAMIPAVNEFTPPTDTTI